MKDQFSCVWEFSVMDGLRAEFEKHYGADGTWVRLFRRAPGYIETLFLADRASPGRYFTIDRWASEESYLAFRYAYGAQYAALDAEFGRLTSRETFHGAFRE